MSDDQWAGARRWARAAAVRSLIACVVVTLLLPARGAAQPVTFDEAIALSGESPRVRGADRALDARREGDRDIAGTSRGLTIEATPGARILSEQDRGFEGQLSITHSWNLGDLTGARREAARAERRVLAAERRAAALDARLEAAHRWIELHRVQELLRVVAEEEALGTALRDATARAVRAGLRTAVDEAELEAHLAETRLRAIALEGARREAALALSVAMARTPTPQLRAHGDPPEPALPDQADVLARIEQLPAVAVARLTAAAERARAIEAAAAHAPELTLGAQIQRESPSGVIASGVVGLAFPLFDRGQRATSAARAEAERREGEHAQARLEAARELALAVHEVEHHRRQEQAARELLVPAAERLVQRREAALAAGEGTLFALLDARRRGLEARARAIEARAARIWAEVRLWLLLAELARAEEAE